jgi:aspartate-semialdehyde dehydrogenase
MSEDIPVKFKDMVVGDANIFSQADGKCSILFSAMEMGKKEIMALEAEYASRGFAVVSNNSAHRATGDVPMIIPEINPQQLEIIPAQQKERGWKGFIVVKPNCSIQSYMLPIYILIQAGYPISQMLVSTLQAVSGAGYPGPASIDLIDNVLPTLSGEEEKAEIEPGKILGAIRGNQVVPDKSITISAHCSRVPVSDGHTACMSLKFAGRKPSMEEIISLWRGFKGLPKELALPSAPNPAIIYREEEDRPQPRKDRFAGNGMAVTVGRLRRCNVMDYRFVGLHHNTIRGAAGGSILTAELLAAKGYLK